MLAVWSYQLGLEASTTMINSAERWTMLILRFSVGKKRVPSVVVELLNQTNGELRVPPG